MINFVLCDDNNIVLGKLCKMLESIFIENNLSAEIVFSTTKAHEILEYQRNNHIDVIILDIDLKSDISGLEIANTIRKTNKDIYIIFTTGHLEYGLIAYKYKTFDYLSKPVTLERFEETILRLFEDISIAQKKFIRIDNKDTLIDSDSINYIKKDGMKLVFYTDSEEHTSYNSFNKICGLLPSNFVRCHKSYLANINKITNLQASTNTITFSNSDYKCFIGPKYKKNLLEVLKNDKHFEHIIDFSSFTK